MANPNQKQAAKPRSKIQASIEKVRQDQRLDVFRKRIDLAKQGLKAFETNRNPEAINFFNAYIRILEDWKDASPGGLNPTFFDRKKEIPEMMLISGVYWTLTKIYDKSQTPTGKEFPHYLEKFIVFSKGLPYQSLSAEHLRKYTNHEKPMHKDAFRNAYKMIGTGGCFIATSLLDVTSDQTLVRLWDFKEHLLEKSKLGRVFIKYYYQVGPWVARGLNHSPKIFRKGVGISLDSFAWCLNALQSTLMKNRSDSRRPKSKLLL